MGDIMGSGKFGLFCGVSIVLASAATPSFAQSQEKRSYDLPAQDLKYALRTVARGAGFQLIADSRALRGKQSKALKGQYTVQEAISALLDGSDLSGEVSNKTVFVRGRLEPSRGTVADATDAEAIVITGSRIRGAIPAAPVLKLGQEEILEQGFTNLGDVARSIPQNFGGSQNPGAGLNVPENSGTRLGGGSSFNLRGLGGDATLTLFNGHRLTYNSFKQAIDVAAIPVAAIDRIEIVADGASAIYGSDAVAGVANIVLKRDYSGLNTAARWGASTDGGNAQQQYGVVGGHTWRTGGLLVAYDFEKDTPILSRQRSYAASTAPGLTLFPGMKRHNVVATGHQALNESLTFSLDALYNRRESDYSYALNAAGNPNVDGAYNFATGTSFSISPELSLELSHGWRVALIGALGEDRTRYGSVSRSGGRVSSQTLGCYCNRSRSIELNADGPLLALPAGALKLAVGAGIRANDFHAYRTLGTAQNIDVSQSSRFAYGELNIPIVAPDQDLAMINRLNLGAALRYESYDAIGDVVTPKLNLVYAPTPDFDIRGSWGKSFRAPTLYQQFTPSSVGLIGAASRGGIGFPSTATVLQLTGGSLELKPERATSWTATFALHPRVVPDALLELSYFNVDYRDRIVAPVSLAQALSNPIYADYLSRNPTVAEQSSVIAGAAQFVNGTGRPYDPANVVAIIYDANVNAAVQKIHGVDIRGEYRFDIGEGNAVRLEAGASILSSDQKLSDLQPEVPLAGRVFNPPHFRGRGGFTWSTGGFTLTTFVNYTGGLDDARATTVYRVSSLTAVDFAARYRVQARGPFDGLIISLSALNAFNAKPGLLQTTAVYETPYDSTNFSPAGRFVSLGLSKQW